MSERTEYKPGTFCWADLVTTDTASAKRFYTSLFGWEATDVPAGPSVYTMFRQDEKDVCALYELSAEMAKQGVPAHWQSYASVANVDESAAKATELGGNVIAPPMDVMEAGRMAVVQDPTGAHFALWQANKNIGAGIVNEPFALCWNELLTRDTEAAVKFYAGLFGWTTNQSTSPMGAVYTGFKNGNDLAGGMLEIRPEWGPVPPNWVVYFSVDNCDAIIEKATGLGAKAVMPAMDIPEVGRICQLHDPLGAYFAIIQLEGPGD